jgi:hypothetical protein
MEDKHSYRYRSFFWPIVLIGVGVIMLMANLDLIPMPSLRLLVRLWPLALVVLGLDILVGRRSPIIGALIGLGAVALVILLIYMAPVLDIVPTVERKVLPINTPLGNTTSAEVTLDLERYATTIDASVDSDDLFDAVLETYTDVDYVARGSQRKTIDLNPVDSSSFDLDWTVAPTRDMTWEIGLSPEVPLDLTVDVGSGSASLDLFDLMLDELKVDGGSGSTDLMIPAGSSRYLVDVNGGSGSFDIEIEDDSEIEAEFDVGSGSFDVIVGSGVEMTLEIDGGSGSIYIDVPQDSGVRLVVDDHGSGGVRVPNGFDLVDDQGDDDGDTGIWESDHYDDADTTIEIRFDPGSGTLTVR